MASFNIRLDSAANYHADLSVLRTKVTSSSVDPADKKTKLKAKGASSAAVAHDVTFKPSGSTLKVWFRESDFYFVGFEANGKLYCFDDKEAKIVKNVTAAKLGVSPNYTTAFFAGKFTGAAELKKLIDKLAAFDGTGKIDEVALYMVALILSEAIRFNAVQNGVGGAIGGNTLKTVDYQELVKNWSKISGGKDTSTQVKRPDGETKTANLCQDLIAVYCAT